jgi:methyl-accepting chemotaxis protein
MSATTLITWAKQIKSTYGKYQSFEKHSAAAKKAASGQKPYEQSGDVQTEMTHLETLKKTLRDVAAKGIGKPEKDLDATDVISMMPQLEGSDAEREAAIKKFALVQLARVELTTNGEELGKSIKEIAQSAATRRDAATQVSNQFGKLAETFPDPTGGSIKLQLVSCWQAFDSAASALAGVAAAADDAAKKIDKDVQEARKKTDGLVKAFEEALKTSEKEREKRKKKAKVK